MRKKLDSLSKGDFQPLHQAIMKSNRLEISRLLAEKTDIEARNS